MIVRVHDTGGHSFMGLVEYLAKEEGRLDWTETRNLMTADPMMAARVMAATAMNQTALKRAAGIPNSGRKPGGPVMHLSISWKDEEAKRRRLTPEVMSGVVDVVLQNLGATKKQRAQYADEHQVVIVAHNDKSHDHLHIVINRVHPEHGVYLPSNNDYFKMSAWALTYEKEGGRIYCPNREINWRVRKQKQSVRGQKQSRKVWNLRKQADNSNTPEVDQAVADNKRKDRVLYQKGRELKARHSRQWEDLSREYKSAIATIKDRTSIRQRDALEQVRSAYQSKWETRFNDKEQALKQFLRDEDDFWGRMKNRFKVIDFSKFSTPGERRKAMSANFEALVSGNVRMRSFARQQNALDAALAKGQRQAEKAVINDIAKQRKQGISKRRDQFLRQRSDLIRQQRVENAAFKEQWRVRNRERNAAYDPLTQAYTKARERKLSILNRKVEQLRQRKASSKRRPDAKADRMPANSSDDANIQKALEKARLLAEFNRRANPSNKPSRWPNR